jgi:CheY-like chemotaxis protein
MQELYGRCGVKRKILAIDDTAAYLDMLDEMLGDMYDLAFSLTGEDGLATAAQILPDLILLDMVLPQMPGWKVLELLRADEKTAHIPVIIMSASEQVIDIGATAFVLKSADSQTLLETVAKYI